MATKKTLSNWLSSRHLLIIRNDENFADKRTIRYTNARAVVAGLLLFIVLMTGSLYLSRSILAQWFDPLHEQMEVNQQIIRLSNAVDSLELEMERKEAFIQSFQTVLYGEDSIDEIRKLPVKTPDQKLAEANRENFTYKASTVDAEFRKQYEEIEMGSMKLRNVETSESPQLFLIPPISGVVSSPFDVRLGHYGIDVVAKTNEPVKCVADGTVLFSSWTMDSGYVIAVQHRNNLISVYKHNSVLLEKVGNFVNAGEVVSIIGNSGEMTDGPHLHFELWYNGNPVNPEDFVSF